MLDNMRIYQETETEELPICEKCGEECTVGFDDSIVTADNEYFCSVDCLLKSMGAKQI